MPGVRPTRPEEIKELERIVRQNEAALARAKDALNKLKGHLHNAALQAPADNQRGPVTKSPQRNSRLSPGDQDPGHSKSARGGKTPATGI